MISLKNNKIKKHPALRLCKTRNDKKPPKAVAKMFIRKSSVSTKVFYFLKNKKKSEKNSSTNADSKILSKRYRSILSKKLKREWVSKIDVICWLQKIGIDVQITNLKNYVVNGRHCSLSQLLVFANRKRVDMGLNPFSIKGVTED